MSSESNEIQSMLQKAPMDSLIDVEDKYKNNGEVTKNPTLAIPAICLGASHQ